MKHALLALIAGLSFSAFANNAEPAAWNKYFCYYEDSVMHYRHGAGATTIGVAKQRAFSECQAALHRSDLSGRCTFVGCKEVIRFESDLFTPAE